MKNQNKVRRLACPRIGEREKQVQSRKQRLFSLGSEWHFRTREGIDIGPYGSKREAENGINSFIRQIGFNLIRSDASSL